MTQTAWCWKHKKRAAITLVMGGAQPFTFDRMGKMAHPRLREATGWVAPVMLACEGGRSRCTMNVVTTAANLAAMRGG